MSISGIRSNRGDGYQTRVAFDWALTVLCDPDFEWLEIDAVKPTVDDVVVGKKDGTTICCQCKKNQRDLDAWSISDLKDELDKAAQCLATDPRTQVRFYSRSPFGELAKLREHSTAYATEEDYLTSLTKEHKKTNSKLKDCLNAKTPQLSTYDFLCRTIFESNSEFDRMDQLLRERLTHIASNATAAYSALWTSLDQLGERTDGLSVSASTRHRLTKDDLKAILHEAGAMLAPPMNLTEVITSFKSTSAVGRQWHRNIAGHRIPNPVLKELLAAVDEKKRSILLTGSPGAGKTCVMLDLQEALEKRTDLYPLFIQSREFANCATDQDRRALGLPEQWVEKSARLSEEKHVVIVIDSLDVLSIGREHTALQYFLAQIDRLLLIPSITIITSCRDFDRQYDQRLAKRRWDVEKKCQPLDWEGDITPLLDQLGIQTSNLDTTTRELIRTPRELSIFVELAQRDGSFNIITSQALAQRHLDKIIQQDHELGDEAMQAIENMANEMLESRSLSVPQQRFKASQAIQRRLLSLNVLQQTQNSHLTFGHQTLLDVLVVSRAIRQGVTLNGFIQSLPPVPFVRPSIRSFVAQLATGERREFRKQIRTVLTGNSPYHIRRLVAECFAEQKPEDGDWSLIRDLHLDHKDVFQVIYRQAKHIEWHYFWMKYLVPTLRAGRDSEGMSAHVFIISKWVNEDIEGVVAFWEEALTKDWTDAEQIAWRLSGIISQADEENIAFVIPLVERLLDIPQQKHRYLGRVIARAVTAGVAEDALLWRYIVGDMQESDAFEYNFGDKLRCQPHQLKNDSDDFLLERMKKSSALLDIAIESIERWGKNASSSHRGFHVALLTETSYDDAHNNRAQHKNNPRILLDAIEAAIVYHAKIDSDWWQKNRAHLRSTSESALRYFAILACSANPEANICCIEHMLCDKELLESRLSYETGTLMQKAFIHLNANAQEKALQTILSVLERHAQDPERRYWALNAQADLIVAIPAHLRSFETQAVLDAYEKKNGSLIRQPRIDSRSGVVSAPFSFEIFLRISNKGVLKLLSHYSGYEEHFSDDLMGGKEEVCRRLNEAASRQPSRFLGFLSDYWSSINNAFCNSIMEGVSIYLRHRCGNLQGDKNWTALEEPNTEYLASKILEELEQHPSHWHFNPGTSNALLVCSSVIQNAQDAARLIFLTIGFVNFREESPISEESGNLSSMGINMRTGQVAEALMLLTSKLLENNISFPELLIPTLRHFAQYPHPAVRTVMLEHLPYLQSLNHDLGWELFHLIMQDAKGLWPFAERCLYHAYRENFETVSPLLKRIKNEGSSEELAVWGRISALAALNNNVEISDLLEELKAVSSAQAWKGAAEVWTHPENIQKYRSQCLAGIEIGLKIGGDQAIAVARQVGHIFFHDTPVVFVPIELIQSCFAVLKNDNENKNRYFYWFAQWLNATVHLSPEQTLSSTESYLSYIKPNASDFYDHHNHLAQLVISLFPEAEEREESDGGAMLRRVLAIQDTLLSLGVTEMEDCLKAAERP